MCHLSKHSVTVFLLVLMLFVSSCSKVLRVYQVESPKLSEKDERYVYEDDTVKVVYDFWYEDGIMLFAMENKLDKAITIDWKKSHFSLNGLVYPYWRDVARISTSGTANTWGSTYNRNFWGFTSFSSSSVASRDSKTSLISPNSWIQRGDYTIIGTYINQVDSKLKYLEQQQAPRSELKRTQAEYYNGPLLTQLPNTERFSANESPLTFRNYLTYSIEGDNKEAVVDNTFWVTEVETSIPKQKKIKEKAYGEKSGTRFIRIEKNKNIQYPKNNIYLGGVMLIPVNYRGTRLTVSIAEIGYSRLIKNWLELGASYTVGFQDISVKWVGQNYESVGLPIGHTITFRANGYVPNRRSVRMSLGLNAYTGFYDKLTQDEQQASSWGPYYAGHNVKNINTKGGGVEIGVNLGGRGFNVNPYFGFGIQNLSGSVESLDGVERYRMNFTDAVIGGGMRLRVQFPVR